MANLDQLEWVLEFRKARGRYPERHEMPQVEGKYGIPMLDLESDGISSLLHIRWSLCEDEHKVRRICPVGCTPATARASSDQSPCNSGCNSHISCTPPGSPVFQSTLCGQDLITGMF